MKDERFYVRIIADDGSVVKQFGPMTKQKAERVEDGIWINLDSENYGTEIVTEKFEDWHI